MNLAPTIRRALDLLKQGNPHMAQEALEPLDTPEARALQHVLRAKQFMEDGMAQAAKHRLEYALADAEAGEK